MANTEAVLPSELQTSLDESGLSGFVMARRRKFGGFQAVFEFHNGYGGSVIRHPGSYGNEQGLFEMAVLKDGHLCYSTPITEDVLGYLAPQQVCGHLKEIQAL